MVAVGQHWQRAASACAGSLGAAQLAGAAVAGRLKLATR
jgi:hypothetical protein